MPAGNRVTLALLAVAVAAGCAGHTPPPSAPPVPAEEIALSLFLVGDAGNPKPGDPVLAELTRQAKASPGGSAIVFLGDNVYPRGIPDSTDMLLREEAERRLDVQLAVARESGRQAWFVPGNHDWARMGADGWNAVRRSQTFIREKAGPVAEQRPRDGCPGPEHVDLAAKLRLVFLDTQWWLHGDNPRPRAPASNCPAASEAEVEAALAALLGNSRDRIVIVVGHHPLLTAGEHGGHFTVWDHLFPLREVKKWLWIPFPVIGSIYPVARMNGISSQDMSGGANEVMRAALERAFSQAPPLLYAAGHEHNLQLFRGPAAEWSLVSGGGYYDHTSHAGVRKGTVYRAAASGFMRLDVTARGAVRLAVIVVEEPAGGREAFGYWLRQPEEGAP